MPLNVCIVSTFFPPAGFGGDAVHAANLARSLTRCGHRVTVIHNPAAYSLLGGHPNRRGADGVDVVTVPDKGRGKAASILTYLTGQPAGYRAALADALARADVIQFNNPSLLGGPGGFGLGRPDAVRLYTTHEHWLLCPTHVLFRYGRELCTRQTCWRCTVAYRRPPQLWRSGTTMRNAVSRLDAILAPSRFTAELHRVAFPGTRIEVLPPLFTVPAETGEAPTLASPMFLFAGRLERIKGVVELVEAFKPVRGAELWIAGDGSEAGAVKRAIGADARVRLLGHVEQPRLAALMRAATAVIVPSLGYETFGGAAAEAMAVGTPVVIRNLGPLPELIEGGGGVAFGTDAELTTVLQRLTDDAELARRLGSQANRVARDRFAEETHVTRYLDIVRSVASQRGLQAIVAAVE